MKTIFENATRHLVCALAALVAGAIALGMAAGPVEAHANLPAATVAVAEAASAL